MSRRGWMAASILLAWLGTLGWHVKRLYFVPMDQLVAEAARTIPPGASYYLVMQGDRRVGWAQSRVDTLPGFSGFVVEDRLEADIELLGQALPTAVESSAELGPTLGLRRFRIQSRGATGELKASGEISGDTLLILAFQQGSAVDSSLVRLDGPVMLEAAWPLRLAAQRVKVGQRFRIQMLDPATRRTRPVELFVEAETVTSYPDSAVWMDGRWVAAREDTVTAWLVRREIAGLELTTWVDEDGRLLEAELPLGLRLERTAFELAYRRNDPPSAAGQGQNDQATSTGEERR